MNYTTITVPANPDLDDCLAGAVADYVSEHPEAEGYDLSPRWADEGTREEVLLDVPITVETPGLDAVHDALIADGYTVARAHEEYLIVPVTDENESGDDALDAIRALVAPLGAKADWTGEGNTDAGGTTTSDVRIEFA